jgi:hypothetical protein
MEKVVWRREKKKGGGSKTGRIEVMASGGATCMQKRRSYPLKIHV